MKLWIYILLLSLLGCNKLGKKANATLVSDQITYVDENGSLLAKGQMTKDSLNMGNWEIYSKGEMVAKGSYLTGLKFGRWAYNYTDFKGEIDWDTLSCLDDLKINYPKNFTHYKKVDTLMLLSPNNEVLILFCIHKGVADYCYAKGIVEGELKKNFQKITLHNCTRITYRNRYSYAMFYDITDIDKFGFYYDMLIQGSSSYVESVMYSKSFERENYQYYTTVFLSIAESMFLDGEQILSGTNQIEEDCGGCL